MGPRLGMKKAQNDESSIGDLLSFPQRCLLILREKLNRLYQIDSKNWPHFQFYTLFQRLVTFLSRGGVDFL